MKKTTISVAVEQEKLRAIQFYMGKSEHLPGGGAG